ncbi:hypothetical protein AAEX28_04745 [Lentisphaerota bacterium WC36G]|nr:hypothetical protein LJT99_07605 [Lentisphaerae bacterium WC36]
MILTKYDQFFKATTKIVEVDSIKNAPVGFGLMPIPNEALQENHAWFWCCYEWKQLENKVNFFQYLKSTGEAFYCKNMNDFDKRNCTLIEPSLFATVYDETQQLWQVDNESLASYEALNSPTKFAKLDIRRAFRTLNKESVLDELLASNTEFAKDWQDANEIDLNDPVTARALRYIHITDNGINIINILNQITN